jgi:hypothetical protein
MKKQLKILASLIAGLMLVISLASCDLELVKDCLSNFINQDDSSSIDTSNPSVDNEENDDETVKDDVVDEPIVRMVLDFDNDNSANSWVFYNLAHTGEKDVCGEIVEDEFGNKQIKIIGEGNKWEGVQFDAPRGLGLNAKKIQLTLTSSKVIENLRFSVEYELNKFMETTVDIPVGTNEIVLEFEQEFSMMFSFSVKTSRTLYTSIYIDNIRVIENKIN